MKKLFIILILYFLLFCFVKKDNSSIEKFSNNDIGYYVLYIPKRYKYIKNVMNQVNIVPKYILGPKKDKIDYDDMISEKLVLQDWLDNSLAIKKYIKPINKGRIACHLGHANILKEFLKSDQKYALIFEDDLNISLNKKVLKVN